MTDEAQNVIVLKDAYDRWAESKGDSADHCGPVPCLWQAADAAIHGEMRHFSGDCNGIANIEQDRAAFET